MSDGCKVIDVDFKNRCIRTTFQYTKSKREVQLDSIIKTLNEFKRQILQMDSSAEYDRFVFKTINVLIAAFRRSHGMPGA